MEVLFSALWKFGPSVLIIAFIVINIVGILKMCKLYDKINKKDVRKFVFLMTDLVLAFAGSAIYFAAFGIGFSAYYILYSAAAFVCVLAGYAIYEQAGVRSFVRKCLKLITSWMKKNPEAAFTKYCKKLGLDVAAETVQKLIEEDNAKKAEEKESEEVVETHAIEETNTEDKTNESIEIIEVKAE